MRAIIVLTHDSPQERQSEGMVRDLTRYVVTPEMVLADSREGVAMRESYGLVTTPAVLVLRDDGSLVQHWQGEWPMASDVSYYYHSS